MERESKNRKTYTVYVTKDKRLELKCCYATSTLYVLTEGELTETVEEATLAKAGEMVATLERYDEAVFAQ